jgi:hypothetical protein
MIEQYKTGKDMYDLLGIGDAGCYASIKNEYHTSVTIYDRRLHAYYGDVREGGTIVDKRPCFAGEAKEAIHLVISGPMLELQLDNGMVKRFMGAMEKWDGMSEIHSFDYVSLNIYLEMWRKVGARVGIRRGDTIVWEDGVVESIVPAELRYRR